MRLNFEGLEVWKWNISTHSVQTDDGLYHRKAFYKVKILFYSSSKNGIIYLVNLFTSAKHGWIFVFSADDSEKIVTV